MKHFWYKLAEIFPNGRDKRRQTTILKKSTASSLQNMFRSIINHRSSSVASGTWRIWISFRVTTWTYVITLPLELKLPGNVTTRLKWIKRAQTVEQRKTHGQLISEFGDIQSLRHFGALWPPLQFTPNFTVERLVAWPLNGNEAGVYLVLIQTLLLFLCKFL